MMATDVLDPSQIDAAVGGAMGVQMPKQKTGVITNELLDRLKMVESSGNPFAVNKQSGAMGAYQFIPTTVEMLGKQGIKFDPFNEPQAREAAKKYLEQLVARHKGDVELALRDYGGHRSMTPDAQRYISRIMGTAADSPTPSSQSQVTSQPQVTAPAQQRQPASAEPDLFSPQSIDAAVAGAMETPQPRGKVAQKTAEFLRNTGRAAASMVDVPLNIATGVLDWAAYPLARFGYGTQMSRDEAAARAKAETTSPKDIVGTYFGVSQTPEYKGEILRRVLEAAAEVPGWIEGKTGIPLTAKTIAQKTGLAQPDVENLLMSGMMMTPAAVASKPGQAVTGAVGREIGYVGEAVKQAGQAVTPKPVQAGVGRAVETLAPGTTGARGFGETRPPTAPQPVGGPGEMGRVSAGAAATSDPTIIRTALQSATPEFQRLYGNMPLDKVNTPVVLRHLEGDSLPIPVRLTEGQATGDVVKLSQEQNLRGKHPEFAQRFNEQNKQLVENVPLIRERAAPDVYATKTIESSQAIIDAYKALDNARNVDIRAAYKVLENANGGKFPVDAQAIVRNADALLAKHLKTNFVPPEIAADLRAFREGAPMTFEQFEALRTNLASEIRKAERSGDGNRAMASSLVRQALEELPLKGEAAKLKPIADTARNLAKQRFDALKKDPAYKAAVDDAVAADKYFDKFVINGINKNINTMVDTLGRNSEAHQHMRAGTINWLSDKAGIVDGRGNFSQANYNKAVKKLDDVKNFQSIFDPESQLQLRTLGNVAGYTQFQPRGAFVNNSNTLVGYLANKFVGGLEAAGNVVGLKTVGYPLGSEARRVRESARERKEISKALEPGAGSLLKDVAKGK